MGTRGFVGYIHQNKVQGWYNQSDSYPSRLGQAVLECYCKYSWNQLKNFFLNLLTFSSSEQDISTADPFQIDWTKDRLNLRNGEDFYKNGLYCEYSYIFDLDCPEKKLLLFSGFGTGPSKGYEDWYYASGWEKMGTKKYYMVFEGALRGELPLIMAEGHMSLIYKNCPYDPEEEPETADQWLNDLRTALHGSLEELPLLIGGGSNNIG